MAKTAFRLFTFDSAIVLSIVLAVVGSFTLPTSLHAGGEVVPIRREFKQTSAYPFVFKPVPYLENGGPRSLRFGPAATDCNQHNPPPLPTAAQGKAPPLLPTPEEPPAPPPITITSGDDVNSANSTPMETDQGPIPLVPAPAYPPPAAYPGGSFLNPEALDMGKMPEEIRSIFSDPYNVPRRNRTFFDPIFEPAVPLDNPIQIGPPSRATYREQ